MADTAGGILAEEERIRRKVIMVQIKPDGNFNPLGGVSVHSGKTDEYREYRRCWSEYPSNFVLRDFPMHLDIEITNRCNLRCTFCDRRPYLGKGSFGDMDMALFKKIIDEGAGHKLWALKLSYRGEPLLHKNVAEMVGYAKKKGVLDVYFNTNGMLLTEEMSKKLIDAGLDRVSISMEGTDPLAYEKMRVNAKFAVVLKNIDTLAGLRKKMKSEHPKIRIQSVEYPGFDRDEYRRFWLSHGDEVAMLDYTDMSKRVAGLTADWACPQLWQRMTIEWNGNVLPCNNDDPGRLSPGNVKDRDIYDCWHDPKVDEVRRLHRSGRSHEAGDCNGCPWRTAQIKKPPRRDGVS